MTDTHRPAVETTDFESVEDVDPDGLLARTQEMAERKARFITATCLDRGAQFEILYSFDLDMEMRHLRLRVDRNTEIPSISGIYLAAFLVENEMKELFGALIVNIAIDYRNRLYLTDESEPTPMSKGAPVEDI